MRRTLALATLLAAATTAADAADKRVTYVMGLTGNPFYSSVACGAADAARAADVTFNAQGPAQWDAALQTQVMNAVIAAHPDAILIAPDGAEALSPTLRAAHEQGIKLAIIDGEIPDPSLAVTAIHSDNVAGGRMAGEKMAELLGGKGVVMALNNAPGTDISSQRLDGFKEAIAKFPGIKFLGVQYSGNQTSKAASLVSSTVAAHPDLSGVFAITTNNTEGAVTGVREARMTGKIKVVGFDTSDPIVDDIRKGLVDADVVQFPYGVGRAGMEQVVAALDGKPTEAHITTPFVLATPANVDTPEVQHYVYKVTCAK